MKEILIIEDEEAIRNELKTLLENSGYKVLMLDDFTDIRERIKNTKSDLILLDINLPNINGEMLLKEIRKESNIPIIMVTSKVSEVDEVLSISYGADDYITKPYNPTILLLRIQNIFKRMENNRDDFYDDIVVNPKKGSNEMRKENNEDNRVKLTNDEANELKCNKDNPTFLHSETERRFGAKVDIELEKKNGKEIYRKKIRYGGFYYLGSLIGVIFLTIVVGICIYDTFVSIKNGDLLNLVFFFIISIGCSAWDYYYLKKLIKEIKEKRKDKEMIKKGLKAERKISFLERLHGAAIILILTFMIYATFALIIQETKPGIVIPNKVNMIIFSGFFVSMVIIVFLEFIVIAIDIIKH